MSARLVSRDDRGPVAVLTLDRPLQRNALSRALLAQLRDALDKVSVDEKSGRSCSPGRVWLFARAWT